MAKIDEELKILQRAMHILKEVFDEQLEKLIDSYTINEEEQENKENE